MTHQADTSGKQTDQYAELPYLNFCFPNTHVDRLATIARLFGMAPPDPRTARVLELGAALGGNLIPMAAALPEARFVGMDLSAPQIEQAKAAAVAADVPNVEFRAADILDIDASWGKFDYVVCHGVYSWVPPAVQAKILSLCAESLTPNGVALVSYNCLPGWHAQLPARDLMRYHAANYDDVKTRLSQGLGILNFVVESAFKSETYYIGVLAELLKKLKEEPAGYVYHEYMEAFNEPLYFHQFAARVLGAGLQYLGDAQLGTMVPHDLPEEVQRTVMQVSPDLLGVEQYLDFIRNRRFRSSLLVRPEVTLKRSFDGSTVAGLRVACHYRRDDTVPSSGAPHEVGFRASTSRFLSTDDPFVQAVIDHLSKLWPRSLPESDLLALVAAEPGRIDPAHLQPHLFRQRLVQLYMKEIVHVETNEPPVTRGVPARPRGYRVAQQQAPNYNQVPNLRHKSVDLGSDQVRLLLEMDGKRTIADLAKSFGTSEEHLAKGVEVMARLSLVHAE